MLKEGIVWMVEVLQTETIANGSHLWETQRAHAAAAGPLLQAADGGGPVAHFA